METTQSASEIETRLKETLDKLAEITKKVASTAERVGIPIATFAVGAVTLWLSTIIKLPVVPWLGAALILASLGTYIWLTGRFTIKVQSPPPPIPVELREIMDWMRKEIEKQNEWARSQMTSAMK